MTAPAPHNRSSNFDDEPLTADREVSPANTDAADDPTTNLIIASAFQEGREGDGAGSITSAHGRRTMRQQIAEFERAQLLAAARRRRDRDRPAFDRLISVVEPHAARLNGRFDQPTMGAIRALSRRAAKFDAQQANHERHCTGLVASVVGMSVLPCVIACLLQGKWYAIGGMVAALGAMFGVGAVHSGLRRSICDETSAQQIAALRKMRVRRRQSFIYESPVDTAQLAVPVVVGYMAALYLVVTLRTSNAIPSSLYDFAFGVLVLLLAITVGCAVSIVTVGIVTIVFRRLISPDPQTAAAIHIMQVVRLLDRCSFHETRVRAECAVHLEMTAVALEGLPRALGIPKKNHLDRTRFESAARYVRGLTRWVHTPQQHTHDDLRNEMLGLLAVVASQLHHYLPQAPEEEPIATRRSVYAHAARTVSSMIVAVLPLLLAVVVLHFVPEADTINPAAILVPAFFLTLVGIGTLKHRDQEKIGAIGTLVNAVLGNAR